MDATLPLDCILAFARKNFDYFIKITEFYRNRPPLPPSSILFY